MNSLAQYFAMGGYAGFVWPAYGLAAIVMIGLAVLSVRRLASVTRLASREGDSRRPR